MSTLSILGSTGAFGRNVLQAAQELDIRIAALTGHANAALMERQARQFHPQLAVLEDVRAAHDLALRLADTDIRVLGGTAALADAAAHPGADTAVVSPIGLSGLLPTLTALRARKRLLIGDKTLFAAAGELLMREAEQSQSPVIPVSPALSAVLQCLQGQKSPADIRRLLLTCAPPFPKRPVSVWTAADLLRHPDWSKKPAAHVNAATLMDAGFDQMEAAHLFHLPAKQIQIVLHPQAMIRSMVEFRDGAVLAQAGTPKQAIAYALTHPRRCAALFEPLDLLSCPPLEFQSPDPTEFPCLRLASEAIVQGGTAGAILSAANRSAVQLFLAGRIQFSAIAECVQRACDAVPVSPGLSLSQIEAADNAAREAVLAQADHMSTTIFPLPPQLI